MIEKERQIIEDHLNNHAKMLLKTDQSGADYAHYHKVTELAKAIEEKLEFKSQLREYDVLLGYRESLYKRQR
ncbi:unnamed protein product [Cuscuta epithymum]|uniref:Uncharacterized protein n=1 Tax=Cuscuta epithymum TaxID=186058 RepID=A0AAV0CXD9_9ASTE|nr:unnamed protein product [Cuscuta epithymum]